MRPLLIAAAILAAGPALADTISIRADPWCPYNCNPKDAKPGYMIEIAQAVFGKAGHTVDYQSMTWSRALAETRDGRITAVVGAGGSEITEHNLIKPALPLGRNVNCFVAHKDAAWLYTSPASLAGRKIGTVQDYSYGQQLDNFFKANPGVAQPMLGIDNILGRSLDKLRSKRLDAVIDDRAVLRYMLMTTPAGSELKEIGCDTADSDNNLYIAFSPKHPKAKDYAKLLSDGVQSLRKEGKLKPILDKYSVPDWQ